MAWNYDPLYELLEKNNLAPYSLEYRAGLTRTQIAEFKKGGSLSMKTLSKLCNYFNCQLNDIVIYIPDNKE